MPRADPVLPLRGDVVACRVCGHEDVHARTLALSACCGRRVHVVGSRRERSRWTPRGRVGPRGRLPAPSRATERVPVAPEEV